MLVQWSPCWAIAFGQGDAPQPPLLPEHSGQRSQPLGKLPPRHNWEPIDRPFLVMPLLSDLLPYTWMLAHFYWTDQCCPMFVPGVLSFRWGDYVWEGIKSNMLHKTHKIWTYCILKKVGEKTLWDFILIALSACTCDIANNRSEKYCRC